MSQAREAARSKAAAHFKKVFLGLFLAITSVSAILMPIHLESAAADAGPTAVVTGTVRGGDSAGPTLAGVKVYVGQTNSQGDGTAVGVTVTTASDGTYVANVPLLSSSYDPYEVMALPSSDGVYGSVTIQPIQPTQTAPTTVDLVMPKLAHVSGSIVWSNGAAVSGADIWAYLGNDFRASTTSGADGSFRFGLIEGNYSFRIKVPGFQDVIVPERAYLAGQVVSLAPTTFYLPATISGHVTNALGQPLPGIRVTWSTIIFTDSNGYYSFQVPAGPTGPSVNISFQDPTLTYLSTTAQIGPSAPEAQVVVDKVLQLGGVIAGKVTASSAPLANFTVRACPAGSACNSPNCPVGCFFGASDFAGNYRIIGLPTGSYAILFYSSSQSIWYKDSITESGATPVAVVAGGQTPGIDEDTKVASSTVSGQVTLAGTASKITSVALYDTAGNVVQKVASSTSGRFTFAKLLAGSYTLHFDSPDDQHLSQWLGNSADRAGATYFTVAPQSQVLNQNISLPMAAPFTSSPRPTITGATTVGSTLTANVTGWSPQPTSFTYQWKSNGAAMPGETGSTHVVTTGDQGTTLTLSITARRSGFLPTTTTSTPLSIPKLISPTPQPTIIGSAVVGQTLTAVTGTWGQVPVTFQFEWRRNGTPIVGSTASTYLLTSADAGAHMSVAVTGSSTGYTTVRLTSAQTTSVLKTFVTSGQPIVSGLGVVGSTLSATSGIWSPNPATLTFQWFRNGLAISGATQRSYVVVSADADSQLQVRATGSAPGYEVSTQSSASTSRILRPFSYVPSPQIMGPATVGTTLFASTPAWGPPPVGLTFQWLSNGVPIPGATGTSYKITPSQTGRKISLTVTGIKSGYRTESRTSLPTAAVK